MDNIAITLNDDGTVTVIVNGLDMSHLVASLRLDVEARDVPRLSLELIPDAIMVEGDAAADFVRNRDDG